MPPRPSCALAALTILAAGVAAQPDSAEIERPRTAGRLVRLFDFEERLTNPYPVPRYWHRHQDDPDAASPEGRTPRPGFPAWNQAYLDYSFAFAGEGSLCLPTSGGSVAIRLDPGVLPVFPSADYLISARVRTHQLAHARARLVVWLLDASSQPIPESRTEGPLLECEQGWTAAAVLVPGVWPSAAFIQVELELLQPERFATSLLGGHQVWPQDLQGAAWFDDLTVAQLPRVSITTDHPGNAIVAPGQPTLRRLVRDMTGEAITARVTVYDDQGKVVDRDERAVATGDGWQDWRPRLGAFGWYRASLDVLSGTTRVGSAAVDFAWLPPVPASRQVGRFSITLSDLEGPVHEVLPDLVRASGVSRVTLPIWTADLTPQSVPERVAGVAPLLSRLLGDGCKVTFSLPRAPATAAAGAGVDVEDPLTLLGAEEGVWGPLLLPFLDKFGQSVQRWQIGRHRVDTPGLPKGLAQGIARLDRDLGRLVPGPGIVIPWPSEIGWVAGSLGEIGPGVLALTIPYGAPPEGFPDLAAAWNDFARERGGRTAVSALFETLPLERYSRRDAAADLVRRAVEFAGAFDPLAAGGGDAPELALHAPWSISSGRSPQVLPHATLAAWRNLADRMRDRRVVGLFPVAPGVRCFILAPAPTAPPGTTGALVAWRHDPVSEVTAIHAYLGDGPVTAIDLFGNARLVPLVPDGTGAAATSSHHLEITDEAVFLEGVDVELAQFAASFRLEPGFAASTHEQHEHEILLTNPWKDAVEGRLVVIEPGGYSDRDGQRDRSWRITPRVIPFSAGPGDTIRVPVSIAFSPVEEAGVRDFVAEIELDSSAPAGRLRVRAPLEIGLESIRLDLSYRFGPTPDGPDLVVEAIIGNNSAAPVTFEVGAFPPPEAGYPRTRAAVSNLQPGDTAVRRFGFPGGAARLRGQRITVGVSDAETQARINRSVTIE